MSASAVIRVATQEVGVEEDPIGSNTGPRVRDFQAATSLPGTGWPWCGAFVQWVLARAGVEQDACSASTESTYLAAKGLGWLSSKPVPGCLILWRGVHVGVVVGVRDGVVDTIEGNSGDRVARRVRAIGNGETYVIPPSIARTAGKVGRVFWLEDPAAEPRVVGPWKSRKWAERRMAKMRPGLQPRLQATTGGRWGILTGPRRRYGPWGDERSRDAAQRILEERLGRRLRAYSIAADTNTARGPAEGLGKTT